MRAFVCYLLKVAIGCLIRLDLVTAAELQFADPEYGRIIRVDMKDVNL